MCLMIGRTIPYLAAWVWRQRHARKANRLEQGHIEQLDKLGFVWDCLEYQWESKYSALVKFRKEYGHCRVSTLSKTHAALGNWVRTQRLRKKQGKLSAERIRRLDMLGFIWDMSASRERPSPTPPHRRFPRGRSSGPESASRRRSPRGCRSSRGQDVMNAPAVEDRGAAGLTPVMSA